MIKLPLMLLFILSFFGAAMAQDKYVTLTDERIDAVPVDYHISGALDDRADKNKIGNIDYGNGSRGNLILADAAQTLSSFVQKNVARDVSTKPVFLHIKNFDVTVRRQQDQWAVDMDATLVFYASGYKLIEYEDKGHAETSDAPEAVVDRFIRKMIKNDVTAFNQWWPENNGSISTSAGVQVNVTVATTTNKPGEIVYSRARPLQIADFTGPAQGTGNEMAATLSGNTMSMSGTVENGMTTITVVITPYFDTRGSWFKEEGKNPAVLAHEQAHFDIAAIKACELAQHIRAARLTKDNYQK